MRSPVSSERAKALAIRDVAEARAHGGKILFVLGLAIVHTAARNSVAALIRMRYIQTIFAGNALVAHDVEATMLGTSLGVDLATGQPAEHGHRNHLRAINAVRTVVVDINPAVMTKLADRGTAQAMGLVTDVELFLRALVEELAPPQPLPAAAERG